jgi:hypothetical protein
VVVRLDAFLCDILRIHHFASGRRVKAHSGQEVVYAKACLDKDNVHYYTENQSSPGSGHVGLQWLIRPQNALGMIFERKFWNATYGSR